MDAEERERLESEFRGEVRGFMKALPDTVKAAAFAAVASHDADPNAHGAGVKRDFDRRAMGWVTVGATLLAGFAGAIGAGVHKLWSHAP